MVIPACQSIAGVVNCFCYQCMSIRSMFNSTHFVDYTFHIGSSFAIKELNFCHKYWAPFIKHEISVVSGIRWYITNLLLRAAKASSVDQMDILLQSEPIASYVNNEAIRIYQTCYHVAKYYTFTVMEDAVNVDSMRGMTGRILSYDNVCNHFNVVVTMVKNLSTEEVRCNLSPSVMMPVTILPTEQNWSSYHLSRNSKTRTHNVVMLKPPPHIPSTYSSNVDLMFRYDLFEALRRKFLHPEKADNGEATKELTRELDRQEASAKTFDKTENRLQQQVMSLLDGGGSCVFCMPFISSDKTLHKSGDGLNEFDLSSKQTKSYQDSDNAIHEKYSSQMILNFNGGSFQSLIPGQDIDDNVCDLCIDW